MYCTATTINWGALHLMMYALPETEMHFSRLLAYIPEIKRTKKLVHVSRVLLRGRKDVYGCGCENFESKAYIMCRLEFACFWTPCYWNGFENWLYLKYGILYGTRYNVIRIESFAFFRVRCQIQLERREGGDYNFPVTRVASPGLRFVIGLCRKIWSY